MAQRSIEVSRWSPRHADANRRRNERLRAKRGPATGDFDDDGDAAHQQAQEHKRQQKLSDDERALKETYEQGQRDARDDGSGPSSSQRAATGSPASSSSVQEGSGFLLGLLVVALGLNYLRGGSAQARGWLAAKFLNKPHMSGVSPSTPAPPKSEFPFQPRTTGVRGSIAGGANANPPASSVPAPGASRLSQLLAARQAAPSSALVVGE